MPRIVFVANRSTHTHPAAAAVTIHHAHDKGKLTCHAEEGRPEEGDGGDHAEALHRVALLSQDIRRSLFLGDALCAWEMEGHVLSLIHI